MEGHIMSGYSMTSQSSLKVEAGGLPRILLCQGRALDIRGVKKVVETYLRVEEDTIRLKGHDIFDWEGKIRGIKLKKYINFVLGGVLYIFVVME